MSYCGIALKSPIIIETFWASKNVVLFAIDIFVDFKSLICGISSSKIVFDELEDNCVLQKTDA